MSSPNKVSLPQHNNPRDTGRIASAPYNFVPLPERVVTAVKSADDLPDHDTYTNADFPHTGYLQVTLTTRSPLYVRGPLTLAEFLRQERGEDADAPFRERVKNKPDFFYARDPNHPVVPGSSLRGMLRNLVEIASYGKVRWVTDKQLFFRTVDNTAVGIYYRDRMVGSIGKKVEAGFLRCKDSQVVIKVCRMARVPRDMLGDAQHDNLYEVKARTKLPRWRGQPHQYQPCWVETNKAGWQVTRIAWKKSGGLHEGCLVITGDMQNKQREFVFLLPEDDAEEIIVREEILERFHDDDQITQWQQQAFSKNHPAEGCRERDGMLRKGLAGEGEPVFFLREENKGKLELTFFGRAQMFRLPYRNRPLDLVPPELRRPEDIDLAEALFGFVRTRQELDEMKRHGLEPQQGDKARAYAGRVFVTDATLSSDPADIWLSPEPIAPKILATPKPTAFQHYLTQQQPDEKNQLDHYDSPPPHETTIRGHKLYWHQDNQTVEHIRETDPQWLEPDGRVKANSTQHTLFNPIKSDIQFTFRVYFENLSDVELGALCWALHPLGEPGVDYCHSLGMGKPLGMGAVKLDATLHLINRTTRYGSLFDSVRWQTGVNENGERLSDRAVLEQRVKPFEERVLDVLRPTDKPCAHLYDLKRIAMLLKLLEWPGFAPELPATPDNRYVGNRRQGRPNTRYMTIQFPADMGLPPRQRNEYRDRLVLPDPSEFDPTLDNKAVPVVAPRPPRPMKQAPEPTPHPDAAPTPPAPRTPQRPPEKLPEVREEVSPGAKQIADLLTDPKRAAEREAEERRKQQARAERKKKR